MNDSSLYSLSLGSSDALEISSASKIGEPIKSLLIKSCPLVTEYKRNRPMLLIGGKEKKLTIKDDFLKEYYNQVYIALDTCKYLETICPFPIYNDAFNMPSQTD